MSERLLKCIDITPNGVLRPGFPQDYRQYRAQPWFPRLLATTSHIRFWVDWPTLQPLEDIPFGDPASPMHHHLTALDEQIRLANQDGLKTILMPYRYPYWLSGTEHFAKYSRENFLHHPADRVAASTWLAWWRDQSNPATILRLGDSLRDTRYQLPADGHGPRSAWGRYVAALLDRYVTNGDRHGHADYFEVVNEPNLQLYPQRSPSSRADDPAGQFEVEGSTLTVTAAVAEMMTTMDRLARRHHPRVICLAPSTSDTDTTGAPRRITIAVNSSWAQMPDPFVPSLLDELDTMGFKARNRWIWAYHNYLDGETEGDRVTAMRETLRRRWDGRRLDGGPMLMATEGGVRLARVATQLGLDIKQPANAEPIRRRQAEILERAFLSHRTSTGVGAGVGLFTQYTIRADPGFDCGLLEADGTERSAFGTWCALEERAPRPRGVATGAPAGV